MNALTKPAVPLLVLSVLAVIGIVVLSVTGHAVPDVLTVVAYAGLTGGAAATVPSHSHDTVTGQPIATDGTTATVATVAAVPVAAVPTAVAPTFPVTPAS